MSERWHWQGPLRSWIEPGGTAKAHFVQIEGAAATDLAARVALRRIELGRKPGGGGVKLSATIGATTWTTQVMPQKADTGSPGSLWVLPVKQAVLRVEALAEGDQVALELEI